MYNQKFDQERQEEESETWISPTGAVIVGTSETGCCVSMIACIQPDGEPIHDGDTETYSLETNRRDGQILFVYEKGDRPAANQGFRGSVAKVAGARSVKGPRS